MIKYSDVFWLTVLTTFLYGFFKFLSAIHIRWRFSKLLPAKRWVWYDVFGTLLEIPWNTISRSGLSLSVYCLENFAGSFQLFKKEKLFCLWCSHFPVVVLIKPEAVEQLFNMPKPPDKAWVYQWFEKMVGKGLFTNSGIKWKTHRKLLEPAFHIEILKSYMHSFNAVSLSTVKTLRLDVAKEYINIAEPFYLCIFRIVCETILGVDVQSFEEISEREFISALHRSKEAILPRFVNILMWYDFFFYFTKTGRQYEKDANFCNSFIDKIIKEKKKQVFEGNTEEAKPKRKAFMDLMIEHLVNKNLTEKEVREETCTFLVAGYETTALAIVWTVYLIGQYKDVQDNLHAELNDIFGNDAERYITTEDIGNMKYLDCVIKESLRLYPPVPILSRRARKGMEICGYPLPEKADIVVLPYQMHRDPDTFPNPEVFDPDRFLPENCVNRHPYSYIPFSAGSRNCIGQRFAMMEMKVVIGNILRNFSVEALDARDKILGTMDITLTPAIPIRMKIKSRTNI